VFSIGVRYEAVQKFSSRGRVHVLPGVLKV
jgi:hypothetical protein